MASGRDDAESVSEAIAQSGGSSGGGSSCLMLLLRVALFVALAITALLWGG